MLASQNNKIIEGWTGQELQWYISQLASVQSADQAQIAQLNQQITALQAQVLQLQQQGGGIPQALQNAINNALTDAGQISQVVSVATNAANDLVTQLQPYKK
jgi:hypothetical protein